MANQRRRQAPVRRPRHDNCLVKPKLLLQMRLQIDAFADAVADFELDDAVFARCCQYPVHFDTAKPELFGDALLRHSLDIIMPGRPSLDVIVRLTLNVVIAHDLAGTYPCKGMDESSVIQHQRTMGMTCNSRFHRLARQGNIITSCLGGHTWHA